MSLESFVVRPAVSFFLSFCDALFAIWKKSEECAALTLYFRHLEGKPNRSLDRDIDALGALGFGRLRAVDFQHTILHGVVRIGSRWPNNTNLMLGSNLIQLGLARIRQTERTSKQAVSVQEPGSTQRKDARLQTGAQCDGR